MPSNQQQTIKLGYKQTEVGVIPADWEVDTVASITPKNAKNGIVDGPFGSNLKTIHYKKSGIPIITSGYVTDGVFQASDYLYVDVEKFKQEKRSAVSAGDIVMAKIGARCGASAIMPEWHETGILSGNALKITVDNARHSTYYIWQVLWNLYAHGQVESLKTVGAQPAISMANLKKYRIPLPPLPEQRAIAAALSDVDALISGLDQLIAKKRDIKQAVMQQLLTGKQRLPGFSGKWECRVLSDLGDFSKGKGIKRDDVISDGIPCIRYGEIYTHHHDHIRQFYSFIPIEVAKQSQKIQKGDLLFAGSGETAEEIGKCVAYLEEEEAYAGGDIVVFSPIGQDSMFLGYLMNHTSIVSQKARMGQGDAVVHISAKNLGQLQVQVPQLPEQTAIATVLTDMDAEIAALEQKREKTRALKQGMMQELLTGRIRLV